MRRFWVTVGAAALGAPLGWGWFEAGWLRVRRVELRVPGLIEELAGLRIIHLSDFHLGMPSRGRRSVERAFEWVAQAEPDLVAVTGDLVSRPRGEAELRRLLGTLESPTFAVLGNHDVERSRDPFSRGAGFVDLLPARLLVDEGELVEIRGRRVQVVGVDPRSYRRGRAEPQRFVDPRADLRVVLCHFPGLLDRLPPGAFHLVLSGHMHDGQITIPYVIGKLRLAHIGARYTTGIYQNRGGTVMHVSPGLGTTLIPFRFFARPEATELVLQPL